MNSPEKYLIVVLDVFNRRDAKQGASWEITLVLCREVWENARALNSLTLMWASCLSGGEARRRQHYSHMYLVPRAFPGFSKQRGCPGGR